MNVPYMIDCLFDPSGILKYGLVCEHRPSVQRYAAGTLIPSEPKQIWHENAAEGGPIVSIGDADNSKPAPDTSPSSTTVRPLKASDTSDKHLR